MAIATFRLSADVGRENYRKTLIMKQGDRASRRLIVQLYEDGNPIVLEPTAVVRMNVRRPDGEIAPSVGSVRADGMIEAIFSDEALAVAGMINVSISVFGEGNALLTSTTIVMMIQPSEGEAELTVYRAAEELETGTYYIMIAGIPFGFTTAKAIPENGTIVFSPDFGTAKTLDAIGAEIENDITVTRGSSAGTQLVGTPVIGMIDELIEQMVETKAIAQSVRDDADAGAFDGADGVSVASVEIRDSHLICVLSDGTELDAGELPADDNTFVITVDGIPPRADAPFSEIQSAIDNGKICFVRYGLDTMTLSVHGRRMDRHYYARFTRTDSEFLTQVGGLTVMSIEIDDTDTVTEGIVYLGDLYQKPSSGIPKSDLTSAVQESLGRADSALQSVPNTYRTAQAQDLIDSTLQGEIEDIEELIPSSASSSNPLVSSSQMSEAISAVEAKQLYKTAAQGSFATKAELLAAQTFYNADGTVATPTKNDVAYVLADESHDGKLAKYVIATTDPSIVWGFVIAISGNEFTDEQLAALNSGITNAKRTGYDTHVANGDIHVTAEQKTAWSGKQDALTAGSGISIVGDVISCTFPNGDTEEY